MESKIFPFSPHQDTLKKNIFQVQSKISNQNHGRGGTSIASFGCQTQMEIQNSILELPFSLQGRQT